MFTLKKPITNFRFHFVLIIILIIYMFGASPALHEVRAASNIFVSTNGTDNSSCGSQTAPCRTIQYAVEKASTGSTIMVAGGTYTYNAVNKCSFLVTRAVVCFVDMNLSIYGGYSANWSVRDPQKYPTIIDGVNSYRGVAVIAYHSTASMLMDGFTIKNGLAKGAPSSDPFQNSAFGGGIWAQNSAVTLKNISFKNNQAVGANLSDPSGGSGSGGGLAIQSTKLGGSSLENVIFDGNQASGGSGAVRGGVAFGGAVFTYGSNLTGTNLTFTNNIARAGNSSGSGYYGGISADGLGGAAGFGGSSTITLNQITALDNRALGGNAGTNGAAGGGFGGGFFSEDGNISLTDARIQGNLAQGGVAKTGGVGMGGGIMTDTSGTTLNRVWVLANKAKSGGSSTSYQVGAVGGGGGYFVQWVTSGVHTTSITNSIFSDNMVELGSPGSNTGGGGGGATFQGIQATVTHSTFAQNILGSGLIIGQAIAVYGNGGGLSAPLGNLTMRYSVISDHVGSANSSAVTVLKNNSASLSYVLFANNTRNTNLDGVTMTPGSITLTNPIYKTSVGYISPGSPNYDYHLRSNSSAIDLATGSTTSTDIDNQSRPRGSAPDVGAVEGSSVSFNFNYKIFLPGVKK